MQINKVGPQLQGGAKFAGCCSFGSSRPFNFSGGVGSTAQGGVGNTAQKPGIVFSGQAANNYEAVASYKQPGTRLNVQG